MTFLEMEQEVIGLRALLKEATVHGLHAEACQVIELLCGDLSHADQIALEDKYCNCWLRYATKVVVEAEIAEMKAKLAAARGPATCTCTHTSTYHAGGDGSGLCMSCGCSCSLFTAPIPTEAP